MTNTEQGQLLYIFDKIFDYIPHDLFIEKLCAYGPLRKKCPYSELFWSAFSRIRTEYEGILCISPYSVRMRENEDQNNSEYGHF